MKTAILILVFGSISCFPTTPPAPLDGGTIPDAPTAQMTPSPSVDLICANMKTAGCPEGLSPTCVQTLANVVDGGLTPINTVCLSKSTATTPSGVRACGILCVTP
jgi:hypothetical protein